MAQLKDLSDAADGFLTKADQGPPGKPAALDAKEIEASVEAVVDAVVNTKVSKLQNLKGAADGFLTKADQGKPNEGGKQVVQEVDAKLESKLDAALNDKVADLADLSANVDDFLTGKANSGQPAAAKDDPRKVPTSVRNKARSYPALARLAVALGKPDLRCPALQQRAGRGLLQAAPTERPGNCTSCCYCPPSFYYDGHDLVPCPVDEYCPGGWFPYDDLQASSVPQACPAGTSTWHGGAGLGRDGRYLVAAAARRWQWGKVIKADEEKEY